jgi:hypothetical protein
MPAPSNRPTSSATAAKTSDSGDSRATSVARRRSAACSSASRWSSSRAWTFDTAVATSSVKRAMRPSMSSGNGPGPLEPAKLTPQVRPSTWIGTPTDVRMPRRRASRPNGLGARNTASSGRRSPRGKLTPVALQPATSVMALSDSNRISTVASAPTSRAISSLTAAKRSFCDTPRATSVATRRKAACSATIRAISSREPMRTTCLRSVPTACGCLIGIARAAASERRAACRKYHPTVARSHPRGTSV